MSNVMTTQQVEALRGEILTIMEDIESLYQRLFGLLSEVRGLHPLDPPNEVKDSLVHGLGFEESVWLRENVRAWAASDLVRRLWLGDSVATGVGSGRMEAYREAIVSLRREEGDTKEAIRHLGRMAEALERVEKTERAKRARADATER